MLSFPPYFILFLQKNLSGSAERSSRAGLACRSDKVSTRGWGFVRPEPPPKELLSPLPSRGCSPLSLFSPPQDQKILLAIYNISMSLRDVAGGTLRGPEEAAVWKVARNTEFVLRENCRRIGKVGALPLPSPPSSSQFPGRALGVVARVVLLALPSCPWARTGIYPPGHQSGCPQGWGIAGETPAWRLSCPDNSLTRQLINQLSSGEALGVARCDWGHLPAMVGKPLGVNPSWLRAGGAGKPPSAPHVDVPWGVRGGCCRLGGGVPKSPAAPGTPPVRGAPPCCGWFGQPAAPTPMRVGSAPSPGAQHFGDDSLLGIFLTPSAPPQRSPPRVLEQPRGRRKQLKEISRRAQRLATCWEKLYALHGPPRGS